jgi:hypothetical protein
MADWRERAEILADVVFFGYVTNETEQGPSEVFVWDLDKTYLDTHFGSLRELWRTALEKAFQKRNVPGTASLVRALGSSWQTKNGAKPFPIYFITASPPQMEGLIKEKLELDEIGPFGCFYKDNLRNLQPKRFWRLTQQVGYKLQALLQLRIRLHDDVRQVFWGDDSESDATVYSLYSDICSRRLSERDLRQVLKGLHVGGEQIDMITELQRRIPEGDPVEKIYINLATDTDPEYYLKFGRRILATQNTFQVALDLFQDRRITGENLLRVLQDMTMNFGFTGEQVEWSLDDLVRRQILGDPYASEIVSLLKEHRVLASDFTTSIAPLKVVKQVGDRVFDLEGQHEPWVPNHIDYLHDFR